MRKDILGPLRAELLTRSALDSLPEGVWKRTGALNTWGTNAIEGNTLSRTDVERILLEQKSVGNRPLSDVLETIQHAAAFANLLERRRDPIRLTTVLELHEEVFRGIKADAGQWRRVNVRIGGMKRAPPRMERILHMMSTWKRSTKSETCTERIRSASAPGCISTSSPFIPSATATVEWDGCSSTCISSNTVGLRSISSRRTETATSALSCGDTTATSPT